MAEFIFQHDSKNFNVVNDKEIVVGDKVHNHYEKSKTHIIGSIVKIIEQRKEKGEYKDESKRRFWAKVVIS